MSVIFNASHCDVHKFPNYSLGFHKISKFSIICIFKKALNNVDLIGNFSLERLCKIS